MQATIHFAPLVHAKKTKQGRKKEQRGLPVKHFTFPLHNGSKIRDKIKLTIKMVRVAENVQTYLAWCLCCSLHMFRGNIALYYSSLVLKAGWRGWLINSREEFWWLMISLLKTQQSRKITMAPVQHSYHQWMQFPAPKRKLQLQKELWGPGNNWL